MVEGTTGEVVKSGRGTCFLFCEGKGAAGDRAAGLFAGGLYRFMQPVARFVLALFAAEGVSVSSSACTG